MTNKIGGLIAALIIASSGTLSHRELQPGYFEITGSQGEDAFEVRNKEAVLACPQGYESMSGVEPTKPDGSAWRWEIRCWISEKSN